MRNTQISWADDTWPITVGCDKVSSGCAGCYAMRDARRMEKNPNPKINTVYSGLVIKQGNGLLNWTGAIKMLPERLDIPKGWKEPRNIFVCSQSDLFHRDVDASFIRQAFEVMQECKQHRFKVLTKRPERFLELTKGVLSDFNETNYPNVEVGVSVENQKAAEERIPLLIQLRAAMRFLSCEPLVGPLSLTGWLPYLHLVIVGGESGKQARPMHPAWARAILRQTQEHPHVVFHFKQWGEWVVEEPETGAKLPTTVLDETTFYRVGRRRAGRLLDGTLYNDLPA